MPLPPREQLPDTVRGAKPRRIAQALEAALQRDPGGWFVVGASRDLPAQRSLSRVVAGRELVVWRDAGGTVHAGPGACPHLGAALGGCEVHGDRLLCRWHGLAFGPLGRPGWQPLPAWDDGVLLWVRLPVPNEQPTERPVPLRRPPPARSITEVVSVPARCEPRDILANRLDPWHGAWLHPYAFSHLTVDEQASDVDRLVLEVAFRLGRWIAVPVRAEFVCPDARTIVMTILSGEGTGSVVETHATPLGTDAHGRPVTVMTEATVAFSERPGFSAARAVSALVRAGMRRSARQLWQDDVAYAERQYQLRARGEAFV